MGGKPAFYIVFWLLPGVSSWKTKLPPAGRFRPPCMFVVYVITLHVAPSLLWCCSCRFGHQMELLHTAAFMSKMLFRSYSAIAKVSEPISMNIWRLRFSICFAPTHTTMIDILPWGSQCTKSYALSWRPLWINCCQYLGYMFCAMSPSP